MESILRGCPFCGRNVSISLNGDEKNVWYCVTDGFGDNACECGISMNGDKFGKQSKSDEYSRQRMKLISKWNTRVCNCKKSSGINESTPTTYRGDANSFQPL